MGDCEISNATSVASSVTTPSSVIPSASAGQGRGGGGRGFQGGGGRVFVVDVQVLAAGSALKQMMPIAIHSNLPHIILQFGTNLDCPHCPSIHCAVDLCAALTTGNFHFFALLAKRFLHCLAKVFAPQDYAPIILSGVVQSHQQDAVTTKLEVGFQFHIPYKTTAGEDSSLMIVTGPHVSVSTILGLPFMQGMGMILDLVDNLAECKYLDCPPFPIDFQRTSNHVPVMDKPSAEVQLAGPHGNVIRVIEHLERYFEAKMRARSSDGQLKKATVCFGSKSTARAAVIDSNSVASVVRPTGAMKYRWVPPSSVHEDDDDYHSSVLREDGYL
jgi:hypothetical protein